MAPEILDSAFEVEVNSAAPAAEPNAPVQPVSEPVPPATPSDEPDPGADPDAGPAGGGGGDAETDTDPEVSEAARKLAAAGKRPKLKSALEDLRERVDTATLNWRQTEHNWRQAERERDALKAEVEALRKGGTPAEAKEAGRIERLPDDPSDPRPEMGDHFQTYEDFVEARARWAARQEHRAVRERDERAAAAHAIETRQAELERKGAEKHADFVAKMSEFAERGGKIGPFLTGAILHHEHGHELAYALASEPHLITEIESSPDLYTASARLGRVLARFDGALTGPPIQAVSTTSAKPPISPVGSSPVVAEPDPTSISEFDEYFTRQNAKDAAARSRR